MFAKRAAQHKKGNNLSSINTVNSLEKSQFRRVIFYVRRIGLYLYKYRIYGTISICILKGLAFAYQLI